MKTIILEDWMVDEVKSSFAYEPNSGVLLRLFGQDSGECGVNRCGVLSVEHAFSNGEQRRLYVHRVAFLLMTGNQPEIVDHVDGNRLNNKFSNLREATTSQNNRNRGIKGSHTTISSGLRVGVTVVNRSYGSYFMARIKVGEKTLRRTFKKYSDACAQRVEWEVSYFGKFSVELSRLTG